MLRQTYRCTVILKDVRVLGTIRTSFRCDFNIYMIEVFEIEPSPQDFSILGTSTLARLKCFMIPIRILPRQIYACTKQRRFLASYPPKPNILLISLVV